MLQEIGMIYWKRIRSKGTALMGIMLLTALFFAFPAIAGWNKEAGNKITFTEASGEKLTGLQTIGGQTYFFNERGILQTGWKATPEGYRYFYEDGKVGARLGAMAAGGVIKLRKAWYGFGEDGVVLTGFQTLDSGSYYFNESEKLGQRGRAVTEKFRDLPDGRRAYFLANGHMAVSRWVNGHKSYVDETGNMLRGTITNDGYLIKANGKVKKKLKGNEFVKVNGNWYFFRKRQGILKDQVFKYKKNYYYVDEEGIRETGWITWGGYDYYFMPNGKAVTGRKRIDGEDYTFNSRGQLEGSAVVSGTKDTTGKASILILCGHGQGDSGAIGCNGAYKEATYTRDFGKRIYESLLRTGSVNVVLFNTNYDMYQQMRATVSSVGSFSGNGKKRKKLLNVIKSNSRIPDLTLFDFALEVHFNATAANAKDPHGNGVKKGTGTYVNIHKSSANIKIDRKIISALNETGLNTWGSGVFGSSTLLNAKVFNELGINYSLLETCFIDDRDDMKFYLKKRDQMADAVANAIVNYFA